MQTTTAPKLRKHIARFGPHMGKRPTKDIIRGAVGAGIAIFLCTIIFQYLPHPDNTGLYLVSSFGAMAVLMFITPNSPLAQPFSAMIGMIVAPLTAMIVLQFVPPPFADGLAVTVAIAVMLALRALHPPAAGLALLVVLQHKIGSPLGYGFILMPVALITCLMVACAMIWNKMFSIAYPVPALDTAPPPSPSPVQNANLSEQDMIDLLLAQKLSTNVATADVAGLVQAATTRYQQLLLQRTTVDKIMTQAPETVKPDAPLSQVVGQMAERAIKSLPVIDGSGRFLGLINNHDAMVALADVLSNHPERAPETFARQLIDRTIAPVAPDTTVSEIVPRLHTRGAHAIPVLDNDKLVGMVSRTDLSMLLMSQLPTADDEGSLAQPVARTYLSKIEANPKV